MSKRKAHRSVGFLNTRPHDILSAQIHCISGCTVCTSVLKHKKIFSHIHTLNFGPSESYILIENAYTGVSAMLTFSARQSMLCCGECPCNIGCLAPSLASTHYIPVAHPTPMVVTIKNASGLCQMSPGGQIEQLFWMILSVSCAGILQKDCGLGSTHSLQLSEFPSKVSQVHFGAPQCTQKICLHYTVVCCVQ